MNFVTIKFDRRITAFKTAINQAKEYKVYVGEDGESQTIVSPKGDEYRVLIRMSKDLSLLGNCECKAFTFQPDLPCKHCYIVAFYQIKDWLVDSDLNSGYSSFLEQAKEKLASIPFLNWERRSFLEGKEFFQKAMKTKTNKEVIPDKKTIKETGTRYVMKSTTKAPFVTPIGDIPPEFIVKIANKPYVTKAGLIFIAKKIGLQSIQTEPVQWSHESRELRAIFKAKVTFDDGSFFEGYGLADKDNVKAKQFLPHLDHLAETRAVCRALRNATASGLVAIEEMPEPTTKELE